MAKTNAGLYALNRGEVSKISLGRLDVDKLRLAAECQLNWMPFVLGPAMLRPGLQYIGEVQSDAVCKPMRFFFSSTDTALIEQTPNVMRIWVNDVLVTRSAVGTTVTNGNFASSSGWDLDTGTTAGASATISGSLLQLQCLPVGGLAQARQALTVAGGDQATEHGLRVVVQRGPVTVRVGTTQGGTDLVAQTILDTGTHSLAFTPGVGTVYFQCETGNQRLALVQSVQIDNPASGPATPLTLPTPYGAGDLANIRYDQSGDIIYVACYGQQQKKIERRSVHGWSVATYQSDDGPFSTLPTVTMTIQPSVYRGLGVMNSSKPYFTNPGHIGALFRIFENGSVYLTQLGAAGAYSPVIRVSGVGTTSRNFNWVLAGMSGSTVTLQRSFDGTQSGFVDVGSSGSNSTNAENTGGSGATPDLDNIIAFYRLGIKPGNYGGDNPTVNFSYTGGGAATVVRVIGVNSSTQAQIEIVTDALTQAEFPSVDATTNWQEGDWSGFQGWPSSVCFFEGRLWWFGRDRIWGSRPDNYTSFATQDSADTSFGDAAAILEAFGFGPVDSVTFGLSLTRLLCGRDGSVASCRASSFDEVLTPTNFSVKDCTTQGAARLPAAKLDTRGIFVARGGRKLYELAFNSQAFDYQAHDLTRLNLDIGKPSFVDIDIARQPDTQIFLPRGDGHCAVMLHDAEDDVEAFWRIQTLGIIENVCVLPSGSGIEDSVYFIVRRVINGVTRRFIEKLATRDNCVGGTVNQQFDCFTLQTGPTGTVNIPQLPNTTIGVWADGVFIGSGTTDGSGNLAMPDGLTHTNIVAGLMGSVQTYSGTPTTTMMGLTAFNGLPCEVFADQQPSGRVIHIGTLTVSGGSITLPNGVTSASIVACFGYTAPFMSAKLAYGAQGGMPLTQKKNIDHVGLALFDAHPSGLQLGQRFDTLDSLPLIEADSTLTTGQVWSEYDEPMIEAPGEWSTDSRLCLLGQAPYPCKVAGVAIGMTTSG